MKLHSKFWLETNEPSIAEALLLRSKRCEYTGQLWSTALIHSMNVPLGAKLLPHLVL